MKKLLQMEDLILKWKLLSSALIMTLLFTGCKERAQILPAKSHEGRNTIGYITGENKIIGGVVQSEDIDESGDGIITFSYKHTIPSFAKRRDFIVTLHLIPDSTGTTYSLMKAEYTEEYFEQLQLDRSESNVFDVTYLDEDRQIVSGIFDLNFAYIDTIVTIDSTWVKYADKHRIKEGRFDIKF